MCASVHESLFTNGPPHAWEPAQESMVAVWIGGNCIDVGAIMERYESPHPSGQTIVSYRVHFDDGGELVVSRNSMRPLP